MAINYEIVKYNRDWEIREKTTHQTICFTKTRRRAKVITAWLNKGGAFNGFTPTFFGNGKRIVY